MNIPSNQVKNQEVTVEQPNTARVPKDSGGESECLKAIKLKLQRSK